MLLQVYLKKNFIYVAFSEEKVPFNHIMHQAPCDDYDSTCVNDLLVMVYDNDLQGTLQ